MNRIWVEHPVRPDESSIRALQVGGARFQCSDKGMNVEDKLCDVSVVTAL